MIDINKIVKAKVMRIEPTFVIVNFNEHHGICHISEISDYHVSNIERYMKLGEFYSFLLIESDEITNKYRLSFKQIRPKLLKHHREIIHSFSGFKNLYAATLKALENEPMHS
ncbi:MAG: S1 RNA-binding domain-containing protein [Mycoplasmataceae bacterium]|jgi:predicted RNA-binding protein with RPS1 domain|nr:S1 RNA-binding domain-containing protein [Mycoplasmataceae bacterium]